MNEILTVVSASRSIWLVRAPLRVSIMLVVGVLFAMSWAITMFGAPSGPYGRGGKEGKGKDGKGGKGKGGGTVLVPDSMMIETRCQMPLRRAELFLNAHQGALWTVELSTLSDEGRYVPQLLRTIKVRSGGIAEVGSGDAATTAPEMTVRITCETTDGTLLAQSHSFDGPVFLANAEATACLENVIGPDLFGTPDEMTGQAFKVIAFSSDESNITDSD